VSNQKTTQLELEDQSPDDSLGLYDPIFKHSSSQSALYQQLIAAEFDKFKKDKEDLANKSNSQQRPYNQLYYRNFVSLINPTSGAWLLAGMSHPSFILSPFEFMAAMCRRNTTTNTSIPQYNRHVLSDNPQNYQCPCHGRIKAIDKHGYHMTACKIGGNAIRLHDNLVHTLVALFRLLGLSVALEPMHMFSDLEADDNRRPDILIRNPYGGGNQIIVDAAVVGFNGSTRTHNNKPQQVVIHREKQKISKYGTVATANGLVFLAAVCSTTGEMGESIKNLLLQQIRLKLQLVDGEVKKSKVQKIMKHCVSHISAAINRSASRNIFLNATKMVNLARHTQQNFSSSTSCDLTSSSASSSPDDLIQQFELQIMNQNVLQT